MAADLGARIILWAVVAIYISVLAILSLSPEA